MPWRTTSRGPWDCAADEGSVPATARAADIATTAVTARRGLGKDVVRLRLGC
ncbi:hypothetical protein GCM10010219_13170 [Streptomyces netropsis]|nr:hypothetical protein GCM10010219_13170 [Streptomyces netropsis]